MLNETVERVGRLTKRAFDFVTAHIPRSRAGGYVALAALLALLGAGTYALRSDGAASRQEDMPTPRAALAVQNPAPSPQPTPEPETWTLPVTGEILAAYSDAPVWSDTLDQWQTHAAMDIAAAPGEAVYACRDGVVSDAWSDRLWGNVIVLDHGDGWQSMYAGLNTLNLVRVGDSVAMGDIISAAAPSVPCEDELPAHVHFALTKDGSAIDPEKLLKF